MMRRLLYTLWYYRAPPWDSGISPPELAAFIRANPPGRALDLGCGTGTNSITLAQNGWQVIGVDFIGKAIHKARAKARQLDINVDFYVDDVTRLYKINGLFNLVLDIGCFHYLTRYAKATYAQNLKHLLAPGGSFLLYGFITNSADADSGITPQDLDLLQKFVTLEDRNDGTDRGLRPSSWFKFRATHPR